MSMTAQGFNLKKINSVIKKLILDNDHLKRSKNSPK